MKKADFGRVAMGFFDSLWGWADYEPKDWSEAAYKHVSPRSGEAVVNFFALIWGWADYEPKNWLRATDKREYPARRSSVAYGWFG